MLTKNQSNPVYFSGQVNAKAKPSARTVILHKRSASDSFGVYVAEDVPRGLYVVTVDRDSPAARAQIQPGDRVLSINGQLVAQMQGSPKQALIQAATKAQSLSLSIQPTDIFQVLNLPSASYASENQHQTKTHTVLQPFQSTGNLEYDLESYIKSIFAGEDVEILPMSNATNRQQFFLAPKTDHSQHRKKNRTMKNIQTQTSQQYETVPSSSRAKQPKRPKIEKQNSNSNYQKLSNDRNLVSEIRLPQISPMATNTAVEVPSAEEKEPNFFRSVVDGIFKSSDDTDSTENLIRIFREAMDEIRERDRRSDLLEQSQKHSIIPLPKDTSIPSSNYESNLKTKRNNQTPTPSTVVEQNPEGYESSTVNRSSTNHGVYNVSQAEASRKDFVSNQLIESIKGGRVRELHIQRKPGFTGFGFNLQYNKIYYLITDIESNSPSEDGGLRENDVIHFINNESTKDMPHSEFVQIVQKSSKIDLIVQPFDAYRRAYPEAVARPVTPAPSVKQEPEDDKRKSILSRAFSKLTRR